LSTNRLATSWISSTSARAPTPEQQKREHQADRKGAQSDNLRTSSLRANPGREDRARRRVLDTIPYPKQGSTRTTKGGTIALQDPPPSLTAGYLPRGLFLCMICTRRNTLLKKSTRGTVSGGGVERDESRSWPLSGNIRGGHLIEIVGVQLLFLPVSPQARRFDAGGTTTTPISFKAWRCLVGFRQQEAATRRSEAESVKKRDANDLLLHLKQQSSTRGPKNRGPWQVRNPVVERAACRV